MLAPVNTYWHWSSFLRNHSNETSHIWQTILICDCIYMMNILRPLSAKKKKKKKKNEHFFICFTPSLITTKRFFVEKTNYTFSETL